MSYNQPPRAPMSGSNNNQSMIPPYGFPMPPMPPVRYFVLIFRYLKSILFSNTKIKYFIL
jgi:hypothetical protein